MHSAQERPKLGRSDSLRESIAIKEYLPEEEAGSSQETLVNGLDGDMSRYRALGSATRAATAGEAVAKKRGSFRAKIRALRLRLRHPF